MNDPNTKIRMTIRLKMNSKVKDISGLSDGVHYRNFPPPELLFPPNTILEVIEENETNGIFSLILQEK
jgi:hypothetical protein